MNQLRVSVRPTCIPPTFLIMEINSNILKFGHCDLRPSAGVAMCSNDIGIITFDPMKFKIIN